MGAAGDAINEDASQDRTKCRRPLSPSFVRGQPGPASGLRYGATVPDSCRLFGFDRSSGSANIGFARAGFLDSDRLGSMPTRNVRTGHLAEVHRSHPQFGSGYHGLLRSVVVFGRFGRKPAIAVLGPGQTVDAI